MRIGVYGATGAVGSSLIIHLLKGTTLHTGDEVVLIGRGTLPSVSKLLAMQSDLLDAFDAGVVSLQVCESMDAAADLDLFIMAAGATMGPGIKKRSDLAARNADLFTKTAASLAQGSPGAFVLIISNPVEFAVSIFSQHIDRCRVVGMGAQQDSLRFARAVASRLGLPRTAVRASVIGEHGEGMLPLWSSVYLVKGDAEDAARLGQLREEFSDSHPAHIADAVRREVDRLLAQADVADAYLLMQSVAPEVKIMVEPYVTVKCLRSTPNATANATMDCIAALVAGDGRLVHGQVCLDGEFLGLHGAFGAPLFLRRNGWGIGTHDPLSDTEAAQARTVCERIQQSLAEAAG